MKNCKWCGVPVDDNVVMCPNCGQFCDSTTSGVVATVDNNDVEMKTQAVSNGDYDPNDGLEVKTVAVSGYDPALDGMDKTRHLSEEEARNAYGNYGTYPNKYGTNYTPSYPYVNGGNQGGGGYNNGYNNGYNGGYNGGYGVQAAPKKKTNAALIIVVSILAVVLIVCLIVFMIFMLSDDDTPSTDTVTSAAITETTTAAETTQTDESLIESINSDLSSAVKNAPESIVGLTVIEGDGDPYDYGSANETHSASACVMYPVLYAYAQLIDEGSMSSSETVTVIGNGQLRGGKVGKDYATVDYLLKLAFKKSNTDAINSLIDHLGYGEIERICNRAGYSSVTVEKLVGYDGEYGEDNRISTSDLAAMIKSMLDDKGYANSIISNCTLIDGEDDHGMALKFTGNRTHSFNGYATSIFNEVMIVKKDGKTYIIALITKAKGKNTEITAKKIGGTLNKCLG